MKHTSNLTAKIILFPQKTSKGFPLKIRITQNRKSEYISLKYYLTSSQIEKYWSRKKKELRPKAAELLLKLETFDKNIWSVLVEKDF